MKWCIDRDTPGWVLIAFHFSCYQSFGPATVFRFDLGEVFFKRSGILPGERLIYGVAENLERFKLAAIDLDGTLLGPDHAISGENALAVRRLQAAGAQVVLASGRHYNSMHKYVAALPGIEWVVSCQGGEVSDAGRTTVLSRQFLRPAEVAEIRRPDAPGAFRR